MNLPAEINKILEAIHKGDSPQALRPMLLALLDKSVGEVIGEKLPEMYGSWTRRKDGTMILLSDEIIITNNLLEKQRQTWNKIKGGK